MKITTVIARFLLGLIFLVFGLNGFLHFIPSPPPSGTAGQFVGALFVSNYLVVVFLLQLISAVLLLINRYVPLALTLLAPIIVNILALSHPDGSERSASGDRRDGAVDRRVPERPLRLRWALAAARPSLNTRIRNTWRLA